MALRAALPPPPARHTQRCPCLVLPWPWHELIPQPRGPASLLGRTSPWEPVGFCSFISPNARFSCPVSGHLGLPAERAGEGPACMGLTEGGRLFWCLRATAVSEASSSAALGLGVRAGTHRCSPKETVICGQGRRFVPGSWGPRRDSPGGAGQRLLAAPPPPWKLSAPLGLRHDEVKRLQVFPAQSGQLHRGLETGWRNVFGYGMCALQVPGGPSKHHTHVCECMPAGGGGVRAASYLHVGGDLLSCCRAPSPQKPH